MRKRELATSHQQILGQRDRVATALVLVNTHDDPPEHSDTS
jgi:hypothetical protein